MVGHPALQPRTAEPALRQFQIHLPAQVSFGEDADAVGDQQPCGSSARDRRGSACGAIEAGQMLAQGGAVDKAVDGAQRDRRGHGPRAGARRAGSPASRDARPSWLDPPLRSLTRESRSAANHEELFNEICHEQTFLLWYGWMKWAAGSFNLEISQRPSRVPNPRRPGRSRPVRSSTRLVEGKP
jgi:hypothetical protein